MTTPELAHRRACERWSNRILILAMLGIACLTLFPFEVRLPLPQAFARSPFYLGGSDKPLHSVDFFLNVLLFVPFGFGISAQVRKRGGNAWIALVLSVAAGAFVSYLVELAQLYIPGRDSGWDDVISNTTGAFVGALFFALGGAAFLEEFSKGADSVERWLTGPRAALVLVAYFAGVFGLTAHLQNKTRLSNWNTQAFLCVGNDASGGTPWRGQVFLLQFWDRALPEKEIRELGHSAAGADLDSGPLASYDFAGTPPYQDQKNLLPPLDLMPAPPQRVNAGASGPSYPPWLRTESPVEPLAGKIKTSNHFTVHVVCSPEITKNAGGRIVSLSQSTDNVNFHFRQDGANLVIWILDPLSLGRSQLAWTVRRVFEPGKTRDIVLAYDGSDAFLYVDGARVPRNYRLSPGAGFIRAITLISTPELGGYVILYELLVFLSAGALVGLEAPKWFRQGISGFWIPALWLVIPAVLLEILQVAMSGRRIWFENITLSVIFGVAGILLMNADRGNYQNSEETPQIASQEIGVPGSR